MYIGFIIVLLLIPFCFILKICLILCRCSALYIVTQNAISFQFGCCVGFDLQKERTAHILTHYLKITIDELRERIRCFALENMAWIDQVGENYFNKNGVTSQEYVKALTTGHVLFDELALLLAAVSNNIHIMVIIENSYWTTRKNNIFNNVDVRLAYTGEISFKEIVPVPEQKENLIVDKKRTRQRTWKQVQVQGDVVQVDVTKMEKAAMDRVQVQIVVMRRMTNKIKRNPKTVKCRMQYHHRKTILMLGSVT